MFDLIIAQKRFRPAIETEKKTHRDHLENISAGVLRLYLFSSRSMPIGGSRLSNGLRLLAANEMEYFS